LAAGVRLAAFLYLVMIKKWLLKIFLTGISDYSILAYQILKLNIVIWNNEIKPIAMNEKKINQFISHQLVRAREEMNYTQMKVQEDKVMSQSNLSKIENGAKNISAAKLYLLASYYKKPIQFFFEK
jgi:Helix-turn-helix